MKANAMDYWESNEYFDCTLEQPQAHLQNKLRHSLDCGS
jgi:hypothetical protein